MEHCMSAILKKKVHYVSKITTTVLMSHVIQIILVLSPVFCYVSISLLFQGLRYYMNTFKCSFSPLQFGGSIYTFGTFCKIQKYTQNKNYT